MTVSLISVASVVRFHPSARQRRQLQLGAGDYQLITSATTRDIYFEKYLHWYSVGGNLAAHSDGLAPLP